MNADFDELTPGDLACEYCHGRLYYMLNPVDPVQCRECVRYALAKAWGEGRSEGVDVGFQEAREDEYGGRGPTDPMHHEPKANPYLVETKTFGLRMADDGNSIEGFAISYPIALAAPKEPAK